MAENGKTRTLRDLMKIVSRRWQWALLATGLTMILILAAAHYMPKKYTSSAVFQVRMNAVSATRDEKAEEWRKERQVIEHELKSPERVRAVLDELGLKKDLPHDNQGLTVVGKRAFQEMVQGYIKSLSVEWVNKSPERAHDGGQINDWLRISFAHSDADLARNVPNMLIDKFKTEYTETTSRDLIAKKKVLVGRWETETDNLAKARKKLTDLRNQDLPETATPIKQKIEVLGRQIEGYRRDLRVAKVRLNGLKLADRQYRGEGPDGPEKPDIEIERDNPEYTRLKNALRETNESLLRLRGEMRMKDQHPTVQYQLRRKERLEKQLANEPEKLREKITLPSAPRTPEFAVRLEMAKTTVEDIESRIEEALIEKRQADAMLITFQADQANLEKIRKDIEDVEKKVAFLEGEIQFTDLQLQNSNAGTRYEINFPHRAEKQYTPSSPKFLMIIGAAILGGLGVGGGLVFLVHKLDRTIRSAEDAREHFDLPVCGVIAEIISPTQKILRRLRRWVLQPVVTILLAFGLLMSVMSVNLWLYEPEKFEARHVSPPKYVMALVGDAVDKVKSVLPF